MAKAQGALYTVHFRRRRAGRTDYEKRLGHLKSGKTRMIVRKTNRNIIVEFAGFEKKGDKVVTSRTSKALKKLGFEGRCNTPSAYLTGMLCAKEAKKKGIQEAILDMGLHKATKGSVVFAAVKGAIDAGIKVPCDKEVIPSEARISGKHLSEEISKSFSECKAKIMSG